jgi:hypothetical protein
VEDGKEEDGRGEEESGGWPMASLLHGRGHEQKTVAAVGFPLRARALRPGVQLSQYCSLGVGGPARLLAEVRTEVGGWATGGRFNSSPRG